MSITPALKAAARSSYRNLYRTASATFAGDEPVLTAFRQKMRDDAVKARLVTNSEEYQQHIELAKNVAVFLRRNIVQGVKVLEKDEETWHLRIHNETELGDNTSIKNPKPVEISRSARKTRRTCSSDTVPLSEQKPTSSPRRSLNYSALKKAFQSRVLPELREEDLQESFVRGSGPGGQSINKTRNKVQLLHKPTGFRVSNQRTRSLSMNRMIARKFMRELIENMDNPMVTKKEMRLAKHREQMRQKRKKTKKKKKAAEQDTRTAEEKKRDRQIRKKAKKKAKMEAKKKATEQNTAEDG